MLEATASNRLEHIRRQGAGACSASEGQVSQGKGRFWWTFERILAAGDLRGEGFLLAQLSLSPETPSVHLARPVL